MKINATPSFNLDLLNLLNIMSGDKTYREHHKDVCGRFYSILNPTIKEKVKELAEEQKTTFLSQTPVLHIASQPDFNYRDLCEMLDNDTIINFVKELKRVGMDEYWQYHKYPLVNSRCRALNEFLSTQAIKGIENIYICAFAAPHITKLNGGQDIMLDYRLTDEAVLKAVTTTHNPPQEGKHE